MEKLTPADSLTLSDSLAHRSKPTQNSKLHTKPTANDLRPRIPKVALKISTLTGPYLQTFLKEFLKFPHKILRIL
jgi:hypothetical protein